MTIKFKFDVSTIVFEYSEQTNEPIIEPTETHSFAQLDDYRFPSIKTIPHEAELELFVPTTTANTKKKILGPTHPKRNSIFQKKKSSLLNETLSLPND